MTRIAGKSLNAIAHQLNAQDMPAPPALERLVITIERLLAPLALHQPERRDGA